MLYCSFFYKSKKRKSEMRTILTTLTIATTIVIGGCKKTKEISAAATASQVEPQDANLAVEVTVENGETKVMVNGEERSIGDLSELMNSIDFGDGEGNIELHIAKMIADGGGHPEDGRERMVEMRVEHGGQPEGRRERMMEMRVEHGGQPEGRRERMMEMRVEHDGQPEGRRERMMEMMHDQDRQEWRNKDNSHEDWDEEWNDEHDNEMEELHQFIDELDVLDAISNRMKASSMSMLGLRMIRDSLEGEDRLEALKTIISKAPKGSTTRNAALITAIETMHELDLGDEATDLMIDLVLTN
jgi:hypothetical protein